MIKLTGSRNYIIIKDKKELKLAKSCDVCCFIILEEANVIYIWEKLNGKWNKNKYVAFGNSKDKDEEITGLKAYQSFYSYCGREEVEKMKHILSPIPMWESYEQLHYCNLDYMGDKLYQPIYEFDANSAFSFGITQLPEGFDLLKQYTLELFEMKRNANNKITASKYKNLQNFLVGYFARVKEFIRVRSEIIYSSNENVQYHMSKIIQHKGICFLSNTDSIITDEKGAEIMSPLQGDGLGQFKLKTHTNKLFYKSPNAYQIGEKVVYSGVKYFARQHTDFFKEHFAEQYGSLIKGFGFLILEEETSYQKLCYVQYGEIQVIVVNSLGEKINTINYKIGD